MEYICSCIRYGYMSLYIEISAPTSVAKYPCIRWKIPTPTRDKISTPASDGKYPRLHQMKNMHACIRWRIFTPASDGKYLLLLQMWISAPGYKIIHSCIRWIISTPTPDKISSPASDGKYPLVLVHQIIGLGGSQKQIIGCPSPQVKRNHYCAHHHKQASNTLTIMIWWIHKR